MAAVELTTWTPFTLDDVGRFTFTTGERVMTSWLPGSRVYETLVVAPDDVLLYLGGDTWEHRSRDEAEAFFIDTVARIQRYPGGGVMASAWHGDEPELCTEPVTLTCDICGKRVTVDPVNHEDEEDYVCRGCRALRHCGPCDEWVKGRECPKCGADTDAPQ